MVDPKTPEGDVFDPDDVSTTDADALIAEALDDEDGDDED